MLRTRVWIVSTVVVISMTVGVRAFTQIGGSAEGRVFDAASFKPVPGARISVRVVAPGKPTTFAKIAVTDNNGTFRFGGLPPGILYLSAEADNYESVNPIPFVTLDAGQDVRDLRIELRGTVTISGRVFDENDEPVAKAKVVALKFRIFGAHSVLGPVGPSVETDDRGEYRISGLSEWTAGQTGERGEYYIRVTAANQSSSKMYPTTYYPNVVDAAHAARITVTAGNEAGGINTFIHPTGVRVGGHFVGSQIVQGLVLIPRSSTVALPLPVPLAPPLRERFEILGVVPGSYYLYAVTGSDPRFSIQWTRTPVEVGSEGIDDLTVVLVTGGTLRGRLVVSPDANGSLDLDLSKVGLTAVSSEITPNLPGLAIRFSKTGEFRVQPVPETTFFLRSGNISENWFVSGLKLNGADVMATGFSVQPGKESVLEVIVSNAGGAITGFIHNERNEPVPAARYVLLPDSGLRNNPMLLRTGAAFGEGTFAIESILPGTYTVVALPDDDRFTPDFLRTIDLVQKYERFGQRIDIIAGQTASVNLTVAPLDRE